MDFFYKPQNKMTWFVVYYICFSRHEEIVVEIFLFLSRVLGTLMKVMEFNCFISNQSWEFKLPSFFLRLTLMINMKLGLI